MSHTSIPLSYYRGGTSKALFFHASDLPPRGHHRNTLLKRLMGTPDPMQIDGIGGTHVVTSKIAIIAPSSRPGVDVDYTFNQVGISTDEIKDDANCGNISAAVGPFAIREGLVQEFREGARFDQAVATQEVRIFNTGTAKVLVSHVPVNEAGHVIEKGDLAIDGVPGTGAAILMDYSHVIGGGCGKGMFPTGNVSDKIDIQGKTVEYTFCDVANLIVFTRAADLGIRGDEKPKELNHDHAFMSRVRELRGKVAHAVGMCTSWEKVDQESPMLPMVALYSTPTDTRSHIQARLILDNKCHTSMAGTGAIAPAAASRVPGTIVWNVMSEAARQRSDAEGIFRIQHPLGYMPVAVKVNEDKEKEGYVEVRKDIEFETLSFVRTSRRILKGEIDVPCDVLHVYQEGMKAEGMKAEGMKTEEMKAEEMKVEEMKQMNEKAYKESPVAGCWALPLGLLAGVPPMSVGA